MTAPDPEVVGDVRAAARDLREDVVALCADLVAAPSVNPPGDTRAVAMVVRRALLDRGIASTQEHRDPSMPFILATLQSGRPGPHLVLLVHLDTMPAGDESAWTVPAFDLTRRDGRLYGLGMGNMKGAVAAMTAAAGILQARRGWAGTITFAAVSDEVVFGENGAAHVLSQHPELTGDAVVCGEGPGFRRTAVGEKGVLWLGLVASGPAGHSSEVRRGESASARLARAVSAVDGLTGHRGSLPPELISLTSAPGDPGLTLTANVGTVAAGTFIGQQAVHGTAGVDLRLPPGISMAAAEDLVRGAVDDPAVEISRIKGWDANWTAPGSALAQAWDHAHRSVTGHRAEHAIRLPASDASRWRRLGVPALCYGPQPTYSAGVDDYAEEDEVLRCVELYALTALHFLGSDAGDGRPGDA